MLMVQKQKTKKTACEPSGGNVLEAGFVTHPREITQKYCCIFKLRAKYQIFIKSALFLHLRLKNWSIFNHIGRKKQSFYANKFLYNVQKLSITYIRHLVFALKRCLKIFMHDNQPRDTRFPTAVPPRDTGQFCNIFALKIYCFPD